MIGGYNHQLCNATEAADVVTTGVELGYPLRGVFEWSARPPTVYPELLAHWNSEIGAALTGHPFRRLSKLQPAGNGTNQAGSTPPAADPMKDGCHSIAAADSGITDQWCVDTCTPR